MREVLKFDKIFDKLKNDIWTTLRDPKGMARHQDIRVELTDGRVLGHARLLAQKNYSLEDIPTELLTYDTDQETREEAIEDLRQYYPDLRDTSILQILVMYWTDKPDFEDLQRPEYCTYCGKLLVKYGSDDVVAQRSYSEITDEIVCQSCARSIRESERARKTDLFREDPWEFINEFGPREFDRIKRELELEELEGVEAQEDKTINYWGPGPIDQEA